LNFTFYSLQLCAEDTVYIEAFENILEAWISVIHDKEYFPTDMLQQYLVQIFNKFLECHIAEGLRGVNRDCDINEISENEEKDRDRFKEQLIIIGCIGREVPNHALPILAKLMEDKVRNLGGQLQRIHSTLPNPTQMTLADSKILENLFDDLHWTLLISGHVLAMESEGESPLIPKEINEYSKQQLATGTTDITNSLKILAAPNQDISDFPNAEINGDVVIRILASVFRLCELEKGAIEVKMDLLLSPELTSTLMWFLKMFADEYLLPQPEYYDSVTLILLIFHTIFALQKNSNCRLASVSKKRLV
jgi:hypothetical protein